MSTPAPTFAPDAALVLGIAATAIPFARTREDEAERWLRVLRLHGAVGAALQALGVSEGSLAASARPGHAHERSQAGDERDVVALVSDRALRLAAARGSDGVGTTDVLVAVLDVYGDVFEQTLREHGTDSCEVLERLAA
jgi:hypothetical protein